MFFKNDAGPTTDLVPQIDDSPTVLSKIKDGLGSVAKMAGQPAAHTAIQLASGKDSVTDKVLEYVGGSRMMNSLISKAAPTIKSAVDSVSQTIHDNLLLNGVFDFDDTDSYLQSYNEAGLLMNNISKQLQSKAEASSSGEKEPPPYAKDFADIGVKQKYLFVVEFVFSEQYKNAMGKLAHAFMVKTCDRPGIQFEYEDINMYNYRTKVVKRAVFQPVSMTFYEDSTSQVTSFYQQYVKSMSPIANVDTPQFFETEGQFSGMDFTQGNSMATAAPGGGSGAIASKYGASIGILGANDHTNGRHIMQKINIYHLYRSGGSVYEDVYTLMNPRIIEAQLDNLSMTESEQNEATFIIDFDSFYGQTLQNPTAGVDPVSTKNITDLTSGAGAYPLNVTNGGGSASDSPIAGFIDKASGLIGEAADFVDDTVSNAIDIPLQKAKQAINPFINDAAIGRLATSAQSAGGVALDKLKTLGSSGLNKINGIVSSVRLDGS